MKEQPINSRDSLEIHIEYLRNQFEKHKYLRVSMKTGKQRTATQNKCLHLYCQQLSNELNDAGLDMRKVVKEEFELPWTMEQVKLILWGTYQKHLTGHKSTTKPETKDYPNIYDALNRHMGQKFGIHVPWPSKDTMDG